MIGRKANTIVEEEAVVAPKGFDDYELRLGDVLRGERATLGKSLLDVQRELRIKASYIAAIENCDPHAFDTPGFIAGYVRSYARYLNLDPDDTFRAFCSESGFAVAHGMSAEASSLKKSGKEDKATRPAGADIFAEPATPFVPAGTSIGSRVEPGAIGSSLVLMALIGAIGFGGWTVLQEVQRVQVAPVDQTPVVLSNLDPLDNVPVAAGGIDVLPDAGGETRADRLDRLYRPQALDVPVLVARDAPIATLDPRSIGNFADTPVALPDAGTGIDLALAEALSEPALPVPQVVEDAGTQLQMMAVSASWVRVRAADGAVIFEGTMQAGDTWDAPLTEEPPTLRTGQSGAIYFAMAGECFGPVGSSGTVTSNFSLDGAVVAQALPLVEPTDQNSALNRMFADLQTSDPVRYSALPCQTDAAAAE